MTGDRGLIPEREPERWLPRPRTAAGAEIAHSLVRRQLRDVRERMHCKCVREGDWRASSVPAAAVIPTPRVSTVDAAVKKSVVVAAIKVRRSRARVLQWLAERTGGTV